MATAQTDLFAMMSLVDVLTQHDDFDECSNQVGKCALLSSGRVN